MTVPARLCRVKGETNYVSFDTHSKMKMKVVFSPPYFVFGYKNVALCSQGCAPLLAHYANKHLMLINSLSTYCFDSH